MNHADRKSAIEHFVGEWHALGARATKLGAPAGHEFGVETLGFLHHSRRDIDPGIMPVLRQREHFWDCPTVSKSDLENLASRLEPQSRDNLRIASSIVFVEPRSHREAHVALGVSELARPLGAAQRVKDGHWNLSGQQSDR